MRNSYFSVIAVPSSVIVISLLLTVESGVSQEKSKVEKALSYKPVQRTVVYDIPEKDEIESCRIEKTLDKFKKPGFVVYDSSGRILRLFFDVDRDNDLDSWSYFKDGIEVYRDVDTNFDGRADEFRWMGSAGTRRGKDVDKNGTVDKWEMLSASELAEEVFEAVRTSDSSRFKKILVSSAELNALGLGDEMSKKVATKLREASANFEKFAQSQKAITSRSKWTQFGSTRPGLVPKGQEGIKKDLVIYDHAAAVFENSGKYGQISLGTIVEVDRNSWRVLELPQLVNEGQVVQNGGLFYPTASESAADTQIADSGTDGTSQDMIKLFEEFDSLEANLKKTTGAANIAKLEEQRAKLLMKLAVASKQKEERQNWIRQMADTVTSSYQSDKFPKGIEFLDDQIAAIKKMGASDQIPYLQWRIIYSRFSVGHQNGDRRARTKANERYISDLEKFADDYSSSEFAADALFQLGLNSEVTERDDLDKAIEWYTKCKNSFPKTAFGKKAAGALTRLTSQGKPLPISGSTITGKRFSLSQYRGKVVIVHYWETWCDTCIDGFEELQRLGAKYKGKVQVIGVNLDQESSKVKKFLAGNRSVNWPQLHSPGGVDKSPLAVQMGIATLPMNILVDQRGNMVESNIPVDELDREIQRILRRESGQANRRGTTR